MLEDDWVRIQVYIPEIFRYKLRCSKPDTVSDSRAVRDLLIHILSIYSEEDILEILGNSESVRLTGNKDSGI